MTITHLQHRTGHPGPRVDGPAGRQAGQARQRFRFVANAKAATGLIILGIYVPVRDHRAVDRAVRPGRAQQRPGAAAVGRRTGSAPPTSARTSSARSWSAPAA